jgi:integrase
MRYSDKCPRAAATAGGVTHGGNSSMSNRNATARRVRVERNIYRRASGVFEVGFKDGAGVQRWRTVAGGNTAARALRDEMLARRGRGERVAPNPRLRFGDAADRWLTGPVADLRDSTRAGYRTAVERHLRPRYTTRRLDTIEAEDLAVLVRELRAEGKSEATIAVVLGVTTRVYKYAARRLGWAGTIPTTLMLTSERPKLSRAQRRPIFEGAQLDQTIAAAGDPYRAMFTLAALTGARVSELCGLTWLDVRLDDLADAEVEFAWQVDRKGNRAPSKTDGSARTVPIPRELAVILARHKLASRDTHPSAYVFATRTGRPLGQRNVTRALRAAQARAHDEHGRPTFQALHERDEHGRPVKLPLGAVPSMHSFRHTVASRALLAGESVDEVAFLLGHRDATVTRAVYIREVADARRRAMRRSRMNAEFGSVLDAAVTRAPEPARIQVADVGYLPRSS